MMHFKARENFLEGVVSNRCNLRCLFWFLDYNFFYLFKNEAQREITSTTRLNFQ